MRREDIQKPFTEVGILKQICYFFTGSRLRMVTIYEMEIGNKQQK